MSEENLSPKEEKHPIVIDNAEEEGSFSVPLLQAPSYVQDNKWTTPATQTLLDLYVENEHKFNDPHTKKKQVWGEISDVLRSQGFFFDADKCERKFLNLKTVYRNNVQHNCMTGNYDRKCSFYEQLDKIFNLSTKLKTMKDNETNANNQRKNNGLPRLAPVTDIIPVRLFPHTQVSPTNPVLSLQKMNNSIPVQMQLSQGHGINNNSNHLHIPKSTPQVSRPNAENYIKISPANTNNHPSQQLMSDTAASRNSQNLSSSTPPTTAVIDLCQETSSSLKRDSFSNRGLLPIDSNEPAMKRKKPNDLQSLLESFENYRKEQRIREDERMKVMKEMHEDEMKVTNRFLDIIQQCVQGGN